MMLANDRGNWAKERALGAPVAFLPESTGHNWGSGRPIGYAFVSALVDERLPQVLPASGPVPLARIDTTKGFLGDNTSFAYAPASGAPGDPKTMSWLPSRAFSEAWSALAKK